MSWIEIISGLLLFDNDHDYDHDGERVIDYNCIVIVDDNDDDHGDDNIDHHVHDDDLMIT